MPTVANRKSQPRTKDVTVPQATTLCRATAICARHMEDAQQRKDRVLALRGAAASEAEQPSAAQPLQQQPDEPVLKFRNYTVKDKKIEHQTIEAAHAPEYVEPVAEPSVVQEVQGQV